MPIYTFSKFIRTKTTQSDGSVKESKPYCELASKTEGLLVRLTVAPNKFGQALYILNEYKEGQFPNDSNKVSTWNTVSSKKVWSPLWKSFLTFSADANGISVSKAEASSKAQPKSVSTEEVSMADILGSAVPTV